MHIEKFHQYIILGYSNDLLKIDSKDFNHIAYFYLTVFEKMNI